MVDALGNPIEFLLTPGQAHDLEGSDAFLPLMQATALLADKAFDADERVIQPLLTAGKTPVIPPKSRRKDPRDYDRDLYEQRPACVRSMARMRTELSAIRAFAICRSSSSRNSALRVA